MGEPLGSVDLGGARNILVSRTHNDFVHILRLSITNKIRYQQIIHASIVYKLPLAATPPSDGFPCEFLQMLYSTFTKCRISRHIGDVTRGTSCPSFAEARLGEGKPALYTSSEEKKLLLGRVIHAPSVDHVLDLDA
eukprot:9107181-Pyramimonas_sp.AAC.1